MRPMNECPNLHRKEGEVSGEEWKCNKERDVRR